MKDSKTISFFELKEKAAKTRQLKDKEKEMLVVKNGKVITIDKSDWATYKRKGYDIAESVADKYPVTPKKAPKLSVGDRVTVRSGASNHSLVGKKGTVYKVGRDKGQYHVRFDGGDKQGVEINSRVLVKEEVEGLEEKFTMPYEKPVGKKIKSVKAKDGGEFEVWERPAKSKQDSYTMYLHGDGKKEYFGSHPSATGALKFAKNRGIIESVELEEKSNYDIYHKDFSSAVQHAAAQVKKQGYEVDEDDWFQKVATGPKKPSSGKTNSYNIDLVDKNGKLAKKRLNMQVYNMDNKKYELNMYVEGVEVESDMLEEGFVQDVYNFLWNAAGKIPAVANKRFKDKMDKFQKQQLEMEKYMTKERIDAWFGEIADELREEPSESTRKNLDASFNRLHRAIFAVIEAEHDEYEDALKKMRKELADVKFFIKLINKGKKKPNKKDAEELSNKKKVMFSWENRKSRGGKGLKNKKVSESVELEEKRMVGSKDYTGVSDDEIRKDIAKMQKQHDNTKIISLRRASKNAIEKLKALLGESTEIDMDKVKKVLGPTKNAIQGRAALKKAFGISDKEAQNLINRSIEESTALEEKELSKAELKKREEIAKAIEKDDPDMDTSKKMAIATATAKKSVKEGISFEEFISRRKK